MTESEYREEDFLQLAGLQHFCFCRRQWALIHIEQQWEENVLTVKGDLFHEKVHDSSSTEKRKNVIVSRGMPIHSRALGVSGECDVVEFFRAEEGISLPGREGKYILYPIEYKRGRSKLTDEDRMQLTAQVICLEEMFVTEIPQAYLFYGETRRRESVEITDALRDECRRLVQEMHRLYERGYTPKVKTGKFCVQCSLQEICMPVLCENRSAVRYIDNVLKEEMH